MKKILLLGLGAVILSCGYRKEKKIRVNKASFEAEYQIWIYKDFEIIEKFSIPIKQADKKKVDSLNFSADKYIEKLKYLESLKK